jgi:hypothetical protein
VRDAMKKLSVVVLLGMMGVGACNTPAKDPPADVPVGTGVASATAPSTPAASAAPTVAASAAPTPTPSVTASASPSAASSAKTPAGKGCASDADCRTWSSYCAEAPCACRVLTKSEGDPKCLGAGPKVNCFADPCMNKAARCQSGACVLTARGATEK